jgi:DNA-binding NarL/FixJ family response regulator
VQHQSNAASIRVVVADENAATRGELRAALDTSRGYEVVGEAADGQRAIDATLLVQPDVLVCGMGLPGMSGLEVSRRVRDALLRTVVVVVSDLTTAVATRAHDEIANDIDCLTGHRDGALRPVATVELGMAETSAALGRQFIEEELAEQRLDGLGRSAALLVSEVVTNAVVHARSHSWVALKHTGARVRVEVTDCGGGAVMLRPLTPSAVGGRGLHIVNGIADLWGAVSTPALKTVWFELATHEDAAATTRGHAPNLAASP